MRRMAMLSGGTVLGQLTLVASSPILTRLYGPESFGGFAVFMSLAVHPRDGGGAPLRVRRAGGARRAGGGRAGRRRQRGLGRDGARDGARRLARRRLAGAHHLRAGPDAAPVAAARSPCCSTGWRCRSTPGRSGAARSGSTRPTSWSRRRARRAASWRSGFAGMGPPGLVLGYCLGPLISFQLLRARPADGRAAGARSRCRGGDCGRSRASIGSTRSTPPRHRC